MIRPARCRRRAPFRTAASRLPSSPRATCSQAGCDERLRNAVGGYEYPLALIASAASLAFTGPGRSSVDHMIGWNLSGVDWGVAALALGALGWLLGTAARHIQQEHPVGQPA